ncbi:hypothetical protein ACIGKR_09020 [Rhodococcus qingshengii]|uniref:hypothetical protein n=1 Tax=Rhodococcus qingshengii TaxID=334542 RepID=UPI0037CBF4F5
MARPRSLAAIATEGDRLKTLEALRDKLARSIDKPGISARDLASLTRHFVQITAEIESLKVRDAAAKNSAGMANDDEDENPAETSSSEPLNPMQEMSAAVKAKRMRIVPAS